MTDAKLTIAIMTSADRWEWTLYERDVGVIASGVSNRHEEAMAEGWSAARRLTPASSNIYPDITLVMPDRRPLTQLSGMTDRGSDLQRTGHHDHLNSRP